ncbi:SDR family oxidoreductase [Pseudolysinimonas kribbensis]|uniref:SDR family oxidoreductase n=1 Tax=Pseudolysinimonas kribbensis TaxID=433641 RepID=UPI0031D6672D
MGRGVAVVTGGSAGLGRAIVRELAGRGWDVAVLARGADGVEAAASEARERGVRAIGVTVDVADTDAVEAAADRVEAELGPIELWVNDAMVSVFGPFDQIEPADFERVIRVVFLGFANGTRAAVRRMEPRGSGHVIQVGSALAHRGIPLQSAYCASKHAIKSLSESVMVELEHRGSDVRISQVDMPAMNTVQFNWVKNLLRHHPQPVPPILQPEVCAAILADVADRPRRRTWVGEATVATILGTRLSARLADRLALKSGFAQEDPSLHEPMLPPNLWEPVPGDHGAHGAFDDRAKALTPQTWAQQHRGLAAAIGAAGAVVAATALASGMRAARR